jgi:hypothetical protein
MGHKICSHRQHIPTMMEEKLQTLKQMVRTKLPIHDHGGISYGMGQCDERSGIDMFSIRTIRCFYCVPEQSEFTVFSKSADRKGQVSRCDPNTDPCSHRYLG